MAAQSRNSRTRSHCPNCGTQYPSYARSCGDCGRKRDQKTAGEMQAESGQQSPFTPQAKPAPAPAPYQFVGQTPTGRSPAKAGIPLWVYPVGFVGFLCTAGSLFGSHSAPAPAPVAPAVYVPSPEEAARQAKQKADDAKFYAEKAKQDARESAQYQAEKARESDGDAQARLNQEYADRQAASQAASMATPRPVSQSRGTPCSDGSYSSSSGQGTCSHHGGIAH